MKSIKIDNRVIGDGNEPFIIAEAGINHNGDINIAKKMILAAKKAGADAVKFQTFHAEEFIQDKETTYTYYSQGNKITESMLEMFRRNEFSKKQWKEIKDFCIDNNIIFLSTPQNESDLDLLMEIGIGAIKIGSDDFINIPLVRKYAKQGLPILLSCGMAEQKEIERTICEVNNLGNDSIVLFLCTSQYPTPPEDVNILKLLTLKELYPNIIVGLSDHTQGIEAAIMAIALGAKVFEKHFTLSHDMQGPDHWFSEEPEELKKWIQSIRRAYLMLGYSELKPTNSEIEMRKIAHRSITALQNISEGEKLTEKNLGMRRPGTGLPPSDWDSVIGKKAVRDIRVGEQIGLTDIE